MTVDRKTHAKLRPDDKAWRKFALKGAPPPSPPPSRVGLPVEQSRWESKDAP